MNGDGYADVIVGIHLYDAGFTNEGGAMIFHGGPSGVGNGNPGNADAPLQGEQITETQFGYAVAGAGDVNGDGFDDVIVGAYLYDSPTLDEGSAFVFHGSATGIGSGNPASAAAELEGVTANKQLGSSVAGAGDLNGDGYADVSSAR